jgi:tRNA uracil 4-sulfurtransferase
MPSDPSSESAPAQAPTGVVVLRIGEIFLKGGNRRHFLRQFLRNARKLVRDLDDVRVEPAHLRALVRYPPELEGRVLDRLSRLFGLSSMSPAVAVARDLDAIAAEAIRAARAWPAGTTFKVETRRRDKRFPMTSQDVSREIGGRVAQDTGLPVDLHHPEVTIEVEIGAEACFVYSRVIPGPGGLPVGSGGRAGLLLSGGIDSPVAGWYAMRRGCRIHGIYFHSFPYTGDKTKEKVLDLARELAAWQSEIAVYVVPFTEVQKALRESADGAYAVLLYRRMMMRAASLIAARERAAALITGDNLGQVASQTLENLGAVEAASSLPVLRPLLGFDKQEIVREAQRIGTYETSILPYDDCCSLFLPKHPATRASDAALTRAERGLDLEAMARSLADGAERVLVRPR